MKTQTKAKTTTTNQNSDPNLELVQELAPEPTPAPEPTKVPTLVFLQGFFRYQDSNGIVPINRQKRFDAVARKFEHVLVPKKFSDPFIFSAKSGAQISCGFLDIPQTLADFCFEEGKPEWFEFLPPPPTLADLFPQNAVAREFWGKIPDATTTETRVFGLLVSQELISIALGYSETQSLTFEIFGEGIPHFRVPRPFVQHLLDIHGDGILPLFFFRISQDGENKK